MEFYDVHFSYIDIETLNEEFVFVPEQGGGNIQRMRYLRHWARNKIIIFKKVK
jgi:predicted ATP-dependent Lon-type protease